MLGSPRVGRRAHARERRVEGEEETTLPADTIPSRLRQRALAVTFDFGQTLADLDTAFLSRRLSERGLAAAAEALEASVPDAWRAYDAAVLAGAGGHPWKTLMRALLGGAGVPADALGPAVDWLWDEQPAKNLWRRPVPGMIELAASLRQRGVAVGILSNSEGRLAELVAELGWSGHFAAIADSGRLGIEKPDRAIFAWTADALGAPLERVVHVGDSYAADVLGAVAAGMRAIWFRPKKAPLADLDPSRIRIAREAADVEAALRAFGIED